MKYEKELHRRKRDKYYPSKEEMERFRKTRESDLRVDKICFDCEDKFGETDCKGAENLEPCNLWIFTQLQKENDPVNYEKDAQYIRRRTAYGYR